MSDLRKFFLGAREEHKRIDVTEHLPEEWQKGLEGSKVYVRALTASQQLDFDKARTVGEKGPDDITLIMVCLVDEENKQIFEPGDRAAVGDLLASPSYLKLRHFCMDVCGFFNQVPVGQS